MTSHSVSPRGWPSLDLVTWVVLAGVSFVAGAFGWSYVALLTRRSEEAATLMVGSGAAMLVLMGLAVLLGMK